MKAALSLCLASGLLAGMSICGEARAADDQDAAPSTLERQSVLPIGEETHHELLLKNDFVNVYGINVPAQDKTLPHKHDFPFVTVSIGPSDVQTTVAGKASAPAAQNNGDVTFSEGGIAQTIEATGAKAYRGVVVELLKPQGSAKNLCQQVVPGPLDCADAASQQSAAQHSTSSQAASQQAAARLPASGKTRGQKTAGRGTGSDDAAADAAPRRAGTADDDVPALETDEIRVDFIRVCGGRDYAELKPKDGALLVALADANITVALGGKSAALLHDGNVLWMPAGVERRVSDFLAGTSSFIVISFRAAQGK
jgi:hypothetical protein